MIVLLNDDLMRAPYATFLRSRRLGRRPPRRAWPLLPRLLLARDGFLGTLAGAGVRAGALPVHGEAPPVAQPFVAADLDLALDVRRDLAAQVTFDLDVAVDERAGVATSSSVRSGRGCRGRGPSVADEVRRRAPDPEDVGQRDLESLLTRDVHTGDSCHVSPAAACDGGSRR